MIIFYTFFSIVTAALFAVNVISGKPRTTVIPGIGSIFYKLYTCVLYAMAAAMFIFACLEQVQPPCDGSGACPSFNSLRDFSLTFDATSNQELWSMHGKMNTSYIFVYGDYSGFMRGTDEHGKSFNTSLGS